MKQKILAGEKDLQKKIKKLRKKSKIKPSNADTANEDSSPSESFSLINKFQKLFLKKDFKLLAKECADLKYENYNLTETNEKLKQENYGLQTQINELLRMDLDNFDVIQNKARQYDKVRPYLNQFSQYYKNLINIFDLFKTKIKINDLHKELSNAIDNFQKIKIYRKFFKEIKKISSFQDLIEEFTLDESNIKNVKKAEEFITKLANDSEYEKKFFNFIENTHKKIINIFNELDLNQTDTNS